MENLFLICAAVGGSILVLQTILLVIGLDSGDADVDVADVDVADVDMGADLASAEPGDIQDPGVDVADASYFRLLSFKTLVAFLTFFGLTGLLCLKSGLGTGLSLFLAIAAGSLALYLVAYLMSALIKLQSQGNVKLENAVGVVGKVYLKVPGHRSGSGKVTVPIQGRTVECKAVTSGNEIPTGVEVRILRMSSSNTMEVASLKEE
ncbi:MAG: hypothetical protein ACE5F1_14605 [Planctomycetota bacterium]